MQPTPHPMPTLRTGSLILEPLVEAHADAMFRVLSDPGLHRFLDRGPPESVEQLRAYYRRLESRESPDGGEAWLNWIVREEGADPVGFVQATIERCGRAWVAYVFDTRSQGHGVATAAMRAMLGHLRLQASIECFVATVEEGNLASIRLLERLGFGPADADALAAVDLSPSERLMLLRPSSPPPNDAGAAGG